MDAADDVKALCTFLTARIEQDRVDALKMRDHVNFDSVAVIPWQPGTSDSAVEVQYVDENGPSFMVATAPGELDWYRSADKDGVDVWSEDMAVARLRKCNAMDRIVHRAKMAVETAKRETSVKAYHDVLLDLAQEYWLFPGFNPDWKALT